VIPPITSPIIDRLYEAAVIGAGPAGAAAAIQLKRYGIDPLVFEKDKVGGLLNNANLVENYPGFPGGISGPELVDRINKQLIQVGVGVHFQKVIEVDYEHDFFVINTADAFWLAKRLVFAVGTEPCSIDVPISPGAVSKVFYEVHPLIQKSGLRVMVVGAGDAAFDYALNIAGREGQAAIVNRGNIIKCLPLLWKRAKECPSISYYPNTRILTVQEALNGIELTARCESPEGEFEMAADYILFAVGRNPAANIFSGRLIALQQGLIEAERLFMVGDAVNGVFRQTAIAAGDGLRAAMQICRDYEREPVEVKLDARRPL
jgi:thioredoxin reductase (NADPH)